ncbi:hypothetical protein, partial [Adlercreutzia sp.]|uniref:hypothetical protein n=1 Tax=Adlercreutzia sp. TaxID=1872387 RepID=UPI003A8A21B1
PVLSCSLADKAAALRQREQYLAAPVDLRELRGSTAGLTSRSFSKPNPLFGFLRPCAIFSSKHLAFLVLSCVAALSVRFGGATFG